MSYSREDPGGGGQKYIQFYYLTSDLFNNVSLRTLYRAANIKEESGQILIDELAITEDEDDAFDILVRDAAHEVFAHVLKMTTGVTDALVLDSSLVIDDSSTTGPYYAIKVKDNVAYNANNLEIVENTIKMLLQVHVMMNWYELKGFADEQAKMMAKYKELTVKLINKDLFQLRKPLLT